MENIEELVTDVTENVEELATEDLVEGVEVGEEAVETTETEVTTEETPKGKFYTDEEFDDIIKRRLERQERKLKKDFKRDYGADLELADIVKQGIGEEDTLTAVSRMDKFYKSNGVEIKPYQRGLSERDEEILANYEADDIISAGYDELVEEVERLAQIGVANMTPREKIVFSKLANERTKQESLKELASIGVGKEVLEDKDFNDFAEKLNPNLSIKEKYEMYSKYRPKPKVEPMGSMKGTTEKSNEVKDFYTREEALQFTREDFDKNPKLFEAVEKSMLKW
jgi:hypothetical protein